MAACAALMASCASKAAFVASTIEEAKTLQELARVNNLEVPSSADSLVKAAEKQNDDNQMEQAFVLADEAVLLLHFTMLKQEEQTLSAEKKKTADNLDAAKYSLDMYKGMLLNLENTPKQQVIK
jgi:hypothetical protein